MLTAVALTVRIRIEPVLKVKWETVREILLPVVLGARQGRKDGGKGESGSRGLALLSKYVMLGNIIPYLLEPDMTCWRAKVVLEPR